MDKRLISISSFPESNLLSLCELTIDNIPDGVLLYDHKGKLIRINRAGLNIFKLTENEAYEISTSFEDHFEVFDMENCKVPLEKRPSYRLFHKEKFHNEKYIVKLQEKDIKIYASYSGIPQIDKKGNFQGGIIFFNDISEQVETQQKLIDDQQLFQAVVDTIPVMVTIFDKQINSLFLNKAVEKITGWKTGDAKGMDLMKLAYPDPAYRKEAADFMTSLTSGFKDLRMRTKDDRDIVTTWTNVDIPDGRRIGIGIDISDRKEMEQELIGAKEKAEKENLLRYAFIQNISHEIRTPMNSVLGYTELLYNKVTEDDEIEFLDAISQNGNQLLRLIDDIIDFSRLDKNELTITKEEISVNEIIHMTQQQISGLEKTYNKKDVRFQFKVPSDEDIILSTDVHRLNQVLTNLISNAIRYTDKGIIEVGYNIDENKKEITFFVKDTGVGIAKENHSLVFERFIRLNDDSKSIIRGTGLGLAICKQLVKLLGGEMGLESTLGKGSLFYFTHPYLTRSSILSNQTDVEEEESVIYPNLENYKLLIAEDDIFSFQMMKHMLSSTKANILHANTGTKTVEIVKNDDIDFLFLDIRLPELNGYQVIKQIRQFNENLPVVAQTANALPDDRQKIINAGFNAHITKPFSQEDLIRVINRFIFKMQENSLLQKSINDDLIRGEK